MIDALLLMVFLGGIRLARRLYREMGQGTGKKSPCNLKPVTLEREKQVLIYGVGNAGEMIVRDMKNNPFYDYELIGFMDDDSAKVGWRIHEVRVLGTRQDLPRPRLTEELIGAATVRERKRRGTASPEDGPASWRCASAMCWRWGSRLSWWT